MLSRRQVLKGLSFLPLLEAFAPRRAWADGSAPLRFVAMFAPNGCVPAQWKPTTYGSSFELPYCLTPLASVRSYVSVLANMRLGPNDNMGSHGGGQICFLTSSDTMTGATSVDQVIGAATESQVVLPTLNLGIENNGYYWPPQIVPDAAGIYEAPNGEDREVRCTDSSSCVVSVSGGTVQSNVYHPQVAFERLFGAAGTGAGGPSPAELKEAARRRRVTDAIKKHAAALKGRVSGDDTRRIDEYLEGVRKIELDLDKLTGSSTGPAVVCDRVTGVTGIPVDRDRYAHLMADLIVRGFQCDANRAATYMLGMGVSPMPFTVDAVTYSHHGDASHHGTDPLRIHAKAAIDQWQVSVFAYLVQQLAAVKDPDGTPLIDRCAVFYSSDIADSDLHDAVDMPVLLAGGLGGALHPGRHLDGAGATTGNLFVSILNQFGIQGPFGKFGTSAMGGL